MQLLVTKESAESDDDDNKNDRDINSGDGGDGVLLDVGDRICITVSGFSGEYPLPSDNLTVTFYHNDKNVSFSGVECITLHTGYSIKNCKAPIYL